MRNFCAGALTMFCLLGAALAIGSHVATVRRDAEIGREMERGFQEIIERARIESGANVLPRAPIRHELTGVVPLEVLRQLFGEETDGSFRWS